MKLKLSGLVFGAGIGFTMAWARLTDPAAIRAMLLLKEPDIFLLMGTAVVVAAVGVRLLRALRVRAFATDETIEWAGERPQSRHVVGSMLFGAGWSVAGTCPGPVAAMIGEGRLGGLAVAAGLIGGVVLQGSIARQRTNAAVSIAAELPGVPGM